MLNNKLHKIFNEHHFDTLTTYYKNHWSSLTERSKYIDKTSYILVRSAETADENNSCRQTQFEIPRKFKR